MPAGHDFNSLLIGALYGELSAVEESLLHVHLAAHPGDQELLGELTRTREAIRTSAALALVEPPQAISALILQEAARRAPRQPRVGARSSEGGWVMRWASVLFAHPGWAAATMAVLVLGVFGTMALRGPHGVVDSTVATEGPALSEDRAAGSASGPASATPIVTPANEQPAAAAPRAMPADPYSVDLAPENKNAASDLEGTLREGDREGEKLRDRNADKMKAAPESATEGAKGAPKRLQRRGYVEAKTEDIPLKDFDNATDGAKKPGGAASATDSRAGDRSRASGDLGAAQIATDDAQDKESAGRVLTKKNAADESLASREEAAPAAASSAPATPAPVALPAPAQTTATVAASRPKATPVYDDTWAKGEHTRLVQLARESKCEQAAAVARNLSERVSRYYQDHVAGDRELRGCAVAIRDQLNQQAEQAKRKRATATKPAAESQRK
jgi:hypothetical protein